MFASGRQATSRRCLRVRRRSSADGRWPRADGQGPRGRSPPMPATGPGPGAAATSLGSALVGGQARRRWRFGRDRTARLGRRLSSGPLRSPPNCPGWRVGAGGPGRAPRSRLKPCPRVCRGAPRARPLTCRHCFGTSPCRLARSFSLSSARHVDAASVCSPLGWKSGGFQFSAAAGVVAVDVPAPGPRERAATAG